MTKLKLAVQSRTFWVILGMFVLNGLQAIQPLVTGETLTIINAILSVATIIFKVFPSQNYNPPSLSIDSLSDVPKQSPPPSNLGS